MTGGGSSASSLGSKRASRRGATFILARQAVIVAICVGGLALAVANTHGPVALVTVLSLVWFLGLPVVVFLIAKWQVKRLREHPMPVELDRWAPHIIHPHPVRRYLFWTMVAFVIWFIVLAGVATSQNVAAGLVAVIGTILAFDVLFISLWKLDYLRFFKFELWLKHGTRPQVIERSDIDRVAIAQNARRVYPVLLLRSGHSIELRRYWTSKQRFARTPKGTLPQIVVEFIGKMHQPPA